MRRRRRRRRKGEVRRIDEEEVEAHKKGGRPAGSTLEHSRAQILARKQAINYVCVQYAEHQEDREKRGAKRVKSGIRNKLAEGAIEMFGINDRFDVPKQTINFRIVHAEWLKVWHPGIESLLLLEVEFVLTSFIHTAHRLCCPLDVGDVIALMNALISGTVHKNE